VSEGGNDTNRGISYRYPRARKRRSRRVIAVKEWSVSDNSGGTVG